MYGRNFMFVNVKFRVCELQISSLGTQISMLKFEAEKLGPVVRNLVSANHWLKGIKTYRFPWYLTLVSANHASSNPGLITKCHVPYGPTYLSRCYTLKLLAETCVQRHREQVSQSGVTR